MILYIQNRIYSWILESLYIIIIKRVWSKGYAGVINLFKEKFIQEVSVSFVHNAINNPNFVRVQPETVPKQSQLSCVFWRVLKLQSSLRLSFIEYLVFIIISFAIAVANSWIFTAFELSYFPLIIIKPDWTLVWAHHLSIFYIHPFIIFRHLLHYNISCLNFVPVQCDFLVCLINRHLNCKRNLKHFPYIIISAIFLLRFPF
jgi:hypothetical protein